MARPPTPPTTPPESGTEIELQIPIKFRCKIPKQSDHRFAVWLLRIVLAFAVIVYAKDEVWKLFGKLFN